MIICLVAVEKNHGIGFENSMPWPRLDSDMEWFKDRTLNHVVLMGSKTWKSLEKPLKDRINVVISSKLHTDADLTLSDPLEAINELKERYSKKDICVIGGESIYNSLKNLVDVYYVTEINAEYNCDKHFDFEFVKTNYPVVNELLQVDATETTPSYIIKEYTK